MWQTGRDNDRIDGDRAELSSDLHVRATVRSVCRRRRGQQTDYHAHDLCHDPQIVDREADRPSRLLGRSDANSLSNSKSVTKFSTVDVRPKVASLTSPAGTLGSRLTTNS